MPVPLYELTIHAATVMAEREIDTAWLELALTRPEWTEAAPVAPGPKSD